jgi:hypothetical protein
MSRRVIKCFMIQPTEFMQVSLRRYNGERKCGQSGMGYCNESVIIEPQILSNLDPDIYGSGIDKGDYSREDPRWPVLCKCGCEFGPDDKWQVNRDLLFKGLPSEPEKLFTHREAPAGAMWDGTWWTGKGPDGMCLYVRLPGGHDWNIDGKASNCDLAHEDHYCWCRIGTPPNITVTKGPYSGQKTCSQGAGSVLIDKGTPSEYHAMLQDGELREC